MLERIKRRIFQNLFYLGNPPWDTGVSPPELKAFLRVAEPGYALDVGCGTGTNLVTLAGYGWEVVGVDAAWLSVLQARSKLKDAGLEGHVLQGDVTDEMPFERTFDLVLDIGCYHSLSPGSRAVYRRNLQKWLGLDGTFLMYAHWRASPESGHGVGVEDLRTFQSFLALRWREKKKEVRPDGSGGFPAVWAKFERSLTD